MSGNGTFNIAPYLTVAVEDAGHAEFTIGKIRFTEVPSRIFFPAVAHEQMMKASDYGVGATVPIPAGRLSALYNWYAEHFCSA